MVEFWDEYRLDSPMDLLTGLGGTVGLLLGMSALSVMETALAAAAAAMERVMKRRSESHNKQ